MTGIAKQRILIVEPEAIAREILADLLKMSGYDVVAAPSGEQALLTLVRERGRVDCLFTAVALPGLVDGWMVADEFRGADPARPVVFASRAEDVRVCQDEASVFVAFPALPPKVVEAVNEVTGRGRAILSARRSPPRVVAESPAPRRAAAPGAPGRARKPRRAVAG